MKKNSILKNLFLSLVLSLLFVSPVLSAPIFLPDIPKTNTTRNVPNVSIEGSFLNRFVHILDRISIGEINGITDLQRIFQAIREGNLYLWSLELTGRELNHEERHIVEQLYTLLYFPSGTNFSVECALAVMISRFNNLEWIEFYRHIIRRYNIDILEVIQSFIDTAIIRDEINLDLLRDLLNWACNESYHDDPNFLRDELAEYVRGLYGETGLSQRIIYIVDNFFY